jgi:hypothetical protein
MLNTIIAFGITGSAVECWSDEIQANCCNFYGNAGGDWVNGVADQADIPGNLSEDPLFCGDENPDAPYTLAADSPCGPSHYPCSLMGAWPVGCASVGVETFPGIPATYTLHPASPNPFNPRVVIRYELPKQTSVTLRIFDLAGRLVDVPVEGENLPAGTHTATWNGRDPQGRAMSSGTYFYRLEAGGYTETKRMTLIR